MADYHQRVSNALVRGVTPERFELMRAEAIYRALQQLTPAEAQIIRDWARNIYNRVRRANADFTMTDALELAGVVSGLYVSKHRELFINRMSEVREEVFLARNPRRILFDDLSDEELRWMAQHNPREIMVEYDINLTQASEWMHRARRRIKLLDGK